MSIENLEEIKFNKITKKNKRFLCPLCQKERILHYSRNLSLKNYLQIITASLFLGYFLFPIFSYKVFFIVFFVWILFEGINKLLYRKDIPCPYCGFDALWYKKDIKIARKRVEEFNQKNSPKKAPSEAENESSHS